MEQNAEQNSLKESNPETMRDDTNIYFYVSEIVFVWLLTILVLMIVGSDAWNLPPSSLHSTVLFSIFFYALISRGVRIYFALKSEREVVIFEENKIRQLGRYIEIDIDNSGEIYLCSNDNILGVRAFRFTTFQKIIFAVVFT